MKLVLILLSCFIAATWQQQNQLFSSPFRVPAYRPPVPYYHQGPYYPAQQPYNPYYHYPKQYYPSTFYQQPRKDVSLQNKALQDLLARLLLSQQLAAQNNQNDDSRVDIEQVQSL